jgi:large subunit ribosomal protein L29
MKAGELRDLSPDELKEKQKELAQELFNLRFQKATGQLGSTATIPKIKKDLARVKTVVRERELSEQSDA